MSATQSLYQHLTFTKDAPYRRYVKVEQSHTNEHGKPVQASETAGITHGSYGALLFHPNWKSKRKEILARDRHQCIHCKRNNNLQVHHRQYHFIINKQQFRLPWEYPDHLLVTLCETCHTRGHNKYKVPTINI